MGGEFTSEGIRDRRELTRGPCNPSCHSRPPLPSLVSHPVHRMEWDKERESEPVDLV